MIDFNLFLFNNFCMAQEQKNKYYVSNRAKVRSSVTKKTQLLKAGLQLFAKKGLKGTTIRDIAKASKVNSSMISYHYKNKEGLYKACLKDIGDNQLKFMHDILTPAKSKNDYILKLELLAEQMLEVFTKEKYSGLLLIREFDRTQSPAADIFKKIFSTTINQLVVFFQSAKKNKIISNKKDEFTLASFCLGLLFSQMRIDHLKHKVYKKSILQPKQKMLFIKQFSSSLS